MQISIRWDNRSLRWINSLPQQFNRAFGAEVARGLVSSANATLEQSKMDAPIFEGSLREDLRVFPLTVLSRDTYQVRIGESGALLVKGEPVQKYDPFSYIWGMEAGAKPHRVWLYGKSPNTKWRKKLRRYVRQIRPGLPEPTEAGYKQSPDYLPFITVAPGPHSFLHNKNDYFVDKFVAHLKRNAGHYWYKMAW